MKRRDKIGVSCFSWLLVRLSYVCYSLLQNMFTADIAFLHFAVPMIHRPQVVEHHKRGDIPMSLEVLKKAYLIIVGAQPELFT